MRHYYFLSSARSDELLLEVFHMNEHGFGFIGDRYNDKRKGFRDVGENGYKLFSRVNCSVGSIRDWSFSGDSKKDGDRS